MRQAPVLFHQIRARLLGQRESMRSIRLPFLCGSYFNETTASLKDHGGLRYCWKNDVIRRTFVLSRNLAVQSSLGTTHSHSLFEEQMKQLQEERDELFGFTNDDLENWGESGGSSHSHSRKFMNAVEEARSTHFKSSDGNDSEGEGVSRVQNSGASIENAGQLGYSLRPPVNEEITELSPKYEQNPFSPSESTVAIQTIGLPTKNENEHRQRFTHISTEADLATMVDISNKDTTRRVAKARSTVVFPHEVMDAFELQSKQGNGLRLHRNSSSAQTEMIGPKGPIFATARIAGIMAAKNTSTLIPLCHPLPLDMIDVSIKLVDNVAVIHCECRVTHKTGVEMEALTGATVTALTIYDMCKAVSHEIRIEGTRLIEKTGGKNTFDAGIKSDAIE